MKDKLTATPKNAFFKLTPEVSRKLISSRLNRSDMNLWLYLVALAPFGDRPYSYSASEAMLACGINKSTYFRSKAKLQKLGLIDFKDGETKFVNKLALVDNSNASKFSTEKIVSEMRLESPKRDWSLQNETEVSEMRLPVAETRSGGGAIPSSDYSDFLKTLSDCERENFKNFGIKKATQLPKQPELPMKWIEANWVELRSQWEQTKEGSAAITNLTDWTQHPDWAMWLEEMRAGVPRFVALGTCFDNKTRRAIADWADERRLIWGEES